MTSIRLYKPNDLDITIRFPETWNECSLAQLHTIARCIFIKPTPQPTLFMELLRHSIAESHTMLDGKMVSRILSFINIHDLSLNYTQLLAFVSEAVSLTHQLQPVLHAPGRPKPEYHGPKAGFEDLTVGEFEDADHCFLRWQEARHAENTKEATAQLCRLCAILYRPHQGDARIPYVGYRFEPHIAAFEKMKLQQLYTVLLWYMGCKAMLPLMFPLVYNTASAAADTDSTPDPMAITRLIHHGAGPKNGTREDIRRMRLHEFLFDLNLEAEKETVDA